MGEFWIWLLYMAKPKRLTAWFISELGLTWFIYLKKQELAFCENVIVHILKGTNASLDDSDLENASQYLYPYITNQGRHNRFNLHMKNV